MSLPVRFFLQVFLFVSLFTYSSQAKQEQRKCGMDRDYWLYTPETIDSARTYWLVVGVHGHRGNGRGAAGLAGWVDKYDNVIVIGPTFPSTGPYYQGLQGKTDKQLIDIHKDLSKEFKLHEKMFLHGFSGGAQYAHRFTLKHPDHVIGVSAHSGGTWEEKPNSKSAKVIWTISCGLQDNKHSAGATLTRIQYFRNFCREMIDGNFTLKPFVTQSGHRATGEVTNHAEECFRVATTGMFDFQRKATEEMSSFERERYIDKTNREVEEVEFNDGEHVHKIMLNKDGWMVSSKALRAMKDTREMQR